MSGHRYRSVIVVVPALVIGLFGCSSPVPETSQLASGAATPPSSSAPTTPATPAGPAAYEGFDEGAGCDMMAGWVWDKNRPDVPVTVEIFNGNTSLGTANADMLRSDLVAAGMGNGRHGFRYPVPASLKDGQPHVIRLTVAGTAFELRHTPKTLTCAVVP